MIICEYGNTELTETHRGSVLVKSYQDSGTHSLKHANMRNSSLRADLVRGGDAEGTESLRC